MAKKKRASKSAPKKPPVSPAVAKPVTVPTEKSIETDIMKLMEEELCPDISINVRFELGVGFVKAKHSRNGKVIDTKTADQSMDIVFDTCCAGDVISLTGVCSKKAIITTNRKTDPLSDTDHPRLFEEQDILDILSVE
jgi:hypothetical protein